MRYKNLIERFDNSKICFDISVREDTNRGGGYQMSIFDEADPIVQKIREEIKQLNVNALSPMEALIKLNEWKSMF